MLRNANLNRWNLALVLTATLGAAAIASAADAPSGTAPLELKVNDATLTRNAKVEPIQPMKDFFSAGRDGVDVGGCGPLKPQLQWKCTAIAEGDYWPAVLISSHEFLFAFPPGWAHLYLNDTRLPWTSRSAPTRPETAADKSRYQAQLRADKIHLKPGDILRVVYPADGGDAVWGSLFLYKAPFTDSVLTYEIPNPAKVETYWVNNGWDEPKRTLAEVAQSCWFYNPGVLPRTFKLSATARDYLYKDLLTQDETITLQPGERVTRSFTVPLGHTGRVRLSLEASAEGVFPQLHMVKFYLDDIKEGPRPYTAMLNSEWEQCFVKAAEPGDAPPADAKWAKIVVPNLAENKDGHCIWLRKKFTAPDFIQGERVLLHFLMCLSEATVYVNGRRVHYQAFGSEPFDADITSAFKPGAENEILVAVRDWIAYSKRNQQRVKDGEEPIFKDNMDAPAGYKASGGWGGCLGIGRPVYLEARPAVSVDDVFVVTSLKNKKLTLQYRVVNKSGADQEVLLTPTILDQGQPFKTLDAHAIKVKAGASETLTVTADWPKGAKLWQPGQPYLYALQTDLKPSSGAADRHVQRFGFKDIWIDGISFIVNGVRMKIRSQWTSAATGIDDTPREPEKRLEDVWLRQRFAMIDADTQLNRTHNQVGVEENCDIADESGLMIKVENGSTAQQNFTFDQGYWKNLIASECRVIDAYKDHASVFLWSAGNENMWGWLYTGEASRTMGNRLQIKTVKAMNDFDLMHRPIEWEADGDLMGGWNYHALHYPREISSAQALPSDAWWGPLDKKTVIPYSMGPITLGEKPLTTGESMGPDSFGHPMGTTVMLGDGAFLGGPNQWRSWFIASRYLVNGMRDVEFALCDTYAPLYMQKPQTVVLKEETTHFFGGRKIVRNINVHNDIPTSAHLNVRWRLIDGQGKKLDSGGGFLSPLAGLTLSPAELKRLKFDVSLPKVAQPTGATFTVELLEGGKVIHAETREWTIFPASDLSTPQGLALSLYDPDGKTAAMLTALKVPFAKLDTIKAPPAGGSLIIGKDALRQPPQGPWREQVDAFVRNGGKVLILEQSDPPDCLPTPLAQAKKARSTISFPRAADHPILAGLGEAELRWWYAGDGGADDHFVSSNNYRKPLDGNCIPIVDIGTMDGMLESPFIEEFSGKPNGSPGGGSYLLCQMMLTDKALTAPPARIMLQNILNYMAAPATYREQGKTALFAGPAAPLRKMLDDARVIYEDSPSAGLKQYKTIIVDAVTGLDPAKAEALKTYASLGGTVMIHRATPAQQPLLESMLGIHLRFSDVTKNEPTDAQNRIQRCSGEGLLGGVSNHDLFWGTNAYIADMEQNGKWWGCFDPRKPEELIAEYYVMPADADADKAMQLTRPCALLQVPCGKGGFVLSQLRIDQPHPDIVPTASRLRSVLLTNLGCAIKASSAGAATRQQRLAKYDFFPVSLAKYANRGLKDDKAAGIVGWTNQEDNDNRNLPVGRQTFADVPFDISTPKSIIVLYSLSGNNKELPKEVKGIEVKHRADALLFLHTQAYGNAPRPFAYRVNYADGGNADIVIESGKQTCDWFSDVAPFADSMAASGTVVGWRGDNNLRKGLNILLYEWANPHPEKEIATVDFLTVKESDYGPVPILIGLTAATMRSDTGVVVDVIGTAGLKVKLGTQVTDIYYTGVAGLPKDHPYYEQALAAHKAMVLNQKVQILDDVVTKNSAGQRIAYVFLAGEQDYMLNNLVNGRLIGDGLAKMGNFEGNNRHRMYLENLQMITQAGKKGLWAKEK